MWDKLRDVDMARIFNDVQVNRWLVLKSVLKVQQNGGKHVQSSFVRHVAVVYESVLSKNNCFFASQCPKCSVYLVE